MTITRITCTHIDMDTPTLTYGELSPFEQAIVSEGRGWDGTHYNDIKSGTVIEALEVDGVAKYRVVVKGDANVTGEVPAEAATEPEAPAAPATDVPVQETEPTAPATDATVPTTDAPAATDVPGTTTDTDTAPTGDVTEPTDPATTDETPKEEDKSFLGRILG